MFGKQLLDETQNDLRAFARDLVSRAHADETPLLEAILCLLGAGAVHLAVGYSKGFVAGAGSHLMLDLGTAQGLPLLVRGC